MAEKTTVREPKQRRSKERVRLILEASWTVLTSEGIKHFNTNSIAACGNIPVSSIYQYFPNKEAILAALYSEYLAEVRDSYSILDTAEFRALPWREYCTLLIKSIMQVETSDSIDEQFEVGLQLHPDLRGIEREHEDWMANRMADDMRRLGSRWSRPKLKRLAHLLYGYNSAIWRYRESQSPPKKELFEWTQKTFLALVSQCFEDV